MSEVKVSVVGVKGPARCAEDGLGDYLSDLEEYLAGNDDLPALHREILMRTLFEETHG